jgi:hypothetical protein
MQDTQVPGRSPKQSPFTQSASTEQCFRSPHGEQDPPQSMSVSVPFCTPSLHEGAAHTPPAQTWLAQSDAKLQSPPVLQPRGHVPPQSTSASPSSFTPSKQWSGAQ